MKEGNWKEGAGKRINKRECWSNKNRILIYNLLCQGLSNASLAPGVTICVL